MNTIVKLIILAILFVPIVFEAAKNKKWYLCLLFAFYPILPDTLAIEVSSSLPLITGKRMLVILVCCVWLYNIKIKKRVHIPKELLIFTIVGLGISVINLRMNSSVINGIFILILEQFMLVMAVKGLMEDEEEIYTCIDFLIYGSVTLGIISVLQTVLKLDVTTAMAVVQDRVVEAITNRMNTVRAFGTTNAIKNGCYCAFMCLIIMFMFEKKRKKRYIIFLGVNLIALVCTMTRSAILALGIVLVAMVIIRNRHFIRTYISYILLALGGVVAVFIMKPSLFAGVIEVAKSVLNVIGFDFELSSDFGFNANNASYSRMVQWSAVYYMIKEGYGFFGYGYNAFLNGRLFYFFKQFGKWTKADALDTGFVGLAVDGGIVGLINNIGLWIGICISSFIRRDRKKGNFDIYKLTIYMTMLYMIINVASAFANTELIWIYLSIFFAYREIDVRRKLCSDERSM